MSHQGWIRGTLWATGVALAWAAVAGAQNVINPGVWTPLAGTTSISGDAALNARRQGFFPGSGPRTATPNRGLILLNSSATALNPANPFVTHGQFVISNPATQTFTVNRAATVGIPLYLQGTITNSLTGGAGNRGSVLATVVILDASNRVVAQVRDTASAASPLSGGSADFKYASVDLAPGTYTLRANLIIRGNADSGLLTSSSVAVNYDSGATPATARNGLATVLSAFPTGLGDSRAAVDVTPAIRNQFGVDGSGVRVGLLEPDRPYGASDPSGGHDSLDENPRNPNAGRLIFLNTRATGNNGTNGTAMDPGFRSEHALATAGIIASRDANPANAGVAPGATIVAAASRSYGGATGVARYLNALNDLVASGVRVINNSSGFTGLPAAQAAALTRAVDRVINDNPRITFVKSAGNGGLGAGNTISAPGMAANIITVGSLNEDFTARRPTSSTSGGALPIKPDIVAPGSYINAPVARDLNGDGRNNDFSRAFLGETFASGHIETGAISGTSFAAPHVAGAAALLQQYSDLHPDHNPDHRVLKAVLLNSATTQGAPGTPLHHVDGTDWRQVSTGSAATRDLRITQSLDAELGAGKLDVGQALRQYQPDPIVHHQVVGNHEVINVMNKPTFWDLDDVRPRAAGQDGLVDYLLGAVGGKDIRATLTWDLDVANNLPLAPLELRFFEEGGNGGNMPGFDVGDISIARTDRPGENVKLFDFTIPAPLGMNPNQYYLEVDNSGPNDTVYGLVVNLSGVAVPAPASATLLLVGVAPLAALLARRRAA